MAEGPEIVFEPNMSRVNAAISAIESQTASHPIEMPIVPGGGVNAPGLRGGGPPIAANIFGGGLGLAAPLATPGFFGTNPAGTMVPVPGAPGAGGGGGGGWGNFGFSLGSLGRLYTAGRAVNAIAGAWEDSRQFNIDTMVAGGDQGGELKAMMDFRQHLFGSAGFVGKAIEYLSDPSGATEAGVKATLNASEVQGKLMAGIARTERARMGLANELLVENNTTPLARNLARITADVQEKQSTLRAAKETAGKESDAYITSQKAVRAADREKHIDALLAANRGEYVGPAGPGGAGYYTNRLGRAEAERQVDKADQDYIAKLRGDADDRGKGIDKDVETAQKIGEAQRSILYRDEGFRLVGVNSSLLADTNMSRNLAAGNANQARIEGLAGQGRQEVIKALDAGRGWREVAAIAAANTLKIAAQRAVDTREETNDLRATQDATGTANLFLARQTLEARQQAVRDRVADANRRLPQTPEGDRQRGANTAFGDVQIAQIGQDDADTKRYRRMELTGEAEGLQLELQNKPQAAAARVAMRKAEESATILREKNEDPDAAQQVLENAITSQQVRKKRLLEAVDAAEVDISQVSLDGPRRGEDTGETLKSINENITGLRTDLKSAGGLKAGP